MRICGNHSAGIKAKNSCNNLVGSRAGITVYPGVFFQQHNFLLWILHHIHVCSIYRGVSNWAWDGFVLITAKPGKIERSQCCERQQMRDAPLHLAQKLQICLVENAGSSCAIGIQNGNKIRPGL